MAKRNFFVRFFSAVWTGADTLRKILHLIVLLFMFSIVVGALSKSTPNLPDNAALLIRPSGVLVEQLEGNPFDRAFAEFLDEAPQQTLVKDIVDGLEFARDDDRIEAVVLDLRGMTGGGLSKLQRIGEAIEQFQQSGKKVIAHASFYDQSTYYLASYADEIYMHPEGMLLVQGYGVYRTYFQEAIEKLRIDWNVFRAGTHKTAAESYTRNDMSDEDRQAIGNVLGALWSTYQEDVAAARSLDDTSVGEFADNFLEYARREDATIAEIAVELGYIDELLTNEQVNDRVADLAGEDDEGVLGYQAAGLKEYLAQKHLLRDPSSGDNNIAVIVAVGEILDGTQPPGTIGGDSTANLLAQARHDESVKAVVLRVDSPGGSAFASEVIRNEVQALQDAGKPVVASMSSVAASGGYWISMAADRILASETTITGSIGVIGMFPTFQRSLAALGVHTDGLGTTHLAGALRPDREMSDEVRQIVQALIEDSYHDFITRVARHRKMDVAAVDRIAQGQIWTGAAAVENGLVDQLGNLDAAIEVAADLAGLEVDDYGLIYYEEDLSPFETLVLQFMGGARSLGLDIGPRPSSVDRLVAFTERALTSVLRFNDPRGIYAHCFCVFDGS
ncbi:MAG: signal peptide peptidase SppA [Woeseia sp.]